jgi:arginine exporter protein ArgO
MGKVAVVLVGGGLVLVAMNTAQVVVMMDTILMVVACVGLKAMSRTVTYHDLAAFSALQGRSWTLAFATHLVSRDMSRLRPPVGKHNANAATRQI